MTLSGGAGGRGGSSGGAGDPGRKRSRVATGAIVVATLVLLYVVISTLATGRFF